MTAAIERAQRNRGTIFVEDGEVLSCEAYPGNQFIMRIRSPKCSAAARPGSFIHLRCDETLPMRRPLSIMRASDGWIEVLYKTVGEGLYLLSGKRPGEFVNVMGPIGVPFAPDPDRPRALLIGGGVGIPPMVFLADELHDDDRYAPLAFLGSEIPFPFELQASTSDVPGVDPDITSAMPLLEDLGIPSRLTSLQGYEGCYRGFVTDLAKDWLDTIGPEGRDDVAIYACGPTAMLKAVAELAAAYEIPAQVSLEEFMACAVGGCAGCTVLVNTAGGQAMKRVCVDGPVFDAAAIAW